MYCTKCGTKLEGDEGVCPQCGQCSDESCQCEVAEAGTAGSRPEISNHLVLGILTTLFCCLPFGIVSIVYGAQVDAKISQGDISGAVVSSDKARSWGIYALIAGIVMNVLVFGFVILMGMIGALAEASQY